MSSKIFDPQYWNLETLFKSVYSVPVYQRPYSWDKEQVDVLLEDLYNAFKEDKNTGYYVGNIIIQDKNEKINSSITKFDIVDGQQRITTFALILLALLCVSLNVKIDANDTTINDLRNSLWKSINRRCTKEYRTVNLNSIEKNAFKDLYDYCFDAGTNDFDVTKYCDGYRKNNKFEERVFRNFNIIINFINNFLCANENDELLDFADFLLQHVDFIVIEFSYKGNKVFSMFESINSKGKKLEEIDLIKTYIFSNLDPSMYEKYLNIWGHLIIETDDNLYDYLYTFIKAYICFYRQNILIVNFKSICKKELLSYYHEYNLSDALKLFLDDLNEKVKYYKYLSSCEDAYELLKSTKFRFYYKIFTDIGYKHPKPLFLRTLIEYAENKINKNEAVDIIVEATKYMIKFLNISGRDSKDAINLFYGVMNEIYKIGVVNKDVVINAIVAELLKQGVTSERLKTDLQSIDAYEQNRKLSIALLSLYDSSYKDDSGKLKISYDQAYVILKNFSSAFSLDHLLVQKPDPCSSTFKYYKDEENNKLKLKPGNDFPNDEIVDGMDYDLFTKVVLNKIGNIRIYYKDKNSGRHNSPVCLAEYSNFNNYSDVVKRSNDIAKIIIDRILYMPSVDMTKISSKPLRKQDNSLPKMEELLEAGVLNIGDELYIISNPDDSKATLIDSKYVNYNGEKMTINDWGCKIKGWKSIRIYEYAAKVGDDKSLQFKRLEYLNKCSN